MIFACSLVVVLPLNYVATFAAFHDRANILPNCLLASFIASFRIETEFTTTQWQSAFLAIFAHGPQFFDAELKAFSSTISTNEYLATCIGNQNTEYGVFYTCVHGNIQEESTYKKFYAQLSWEYASICVHACVSCMHVHVQRVLPRVLQHPCGCGELYIGYITFPANGSGRLEWDRSAGGELKHSWYFWSSKRDGSAGYSW